MVNNKEINMVKLGDILSTSFTNGVYKSSNHYGTGVSILRITDFDNDGYLITDNLQQVELSDAEVSNYKLQPKDIVVNRVNSLTHIGKSILWMDTKNEVTVYESNMMRIKPKESVVLPEYLIKILHSDSARNHYKRVAKRAIGQSSINQQDVKSLLFFLPPLPEQQKIAQFLTTWDKAIETTERLIDNSKQQKKALIQKLISGDYRLTGFVDPWIETTVSKVLTRRNLRQTPSPEVPLYSLTIEKGITPKTERYDREFLVKDKTEKKYKLVKPLDIVFNPANLRWGAINYSKLNHDVVVSPIYETLYITDPMKVSLEFVAQALMSENQIRRFASMVEGTLIERMAVKIDPFLATKLKIPPSLKEQQKIAAVLTNSDKEIELLEQQLADLQQEKKALMQVLLTGKKRVRIDG